MEKVWFKLRQPDYCPEREQDMGSGNDEAPLCLGHFISDLKHLDFVLNRSKIEKFPASMPVHHTKSLQFEWKDFKVAETGGQLGASAPIAALIGLVFKADIRLLFRRTVEHWERYERLDTYIVQPTKTYVDDCLQSNELAMRIKGKKSWSMFMITGVKVARMGKTDSSESNQSEGSANFEVDVPTAASASVDAHVARGDSQRFGGSQTSDFIWAVRLAKISQGSLRREWSLEPYSSRATFDMDEQEVDVKRIMEDEGLEKFMILEDEQLDEAVVLEAGEQFGNEEELEAKNAADEAPDDGPAKKN